MKYIYLIVIFVLFFSCKNTVKEHIPEATEKDIITVILNNNLTPIHSNDTISLGIISDDTSVVIDSIIVVVKNKKINAMKHSDNSYGIPAADIPLGTATGTVFTFYSDSLNEADDITVELLSDIIPQEIKYKIVNVFPHDETAFTQGLWYENGVFYESTGLYGKSSLRKVDVKSGKVLKNIMIGDSYFGEGLAVYDNKIVQITWKSGTGFVYDKESMEIQKTFRYRYDEGWGLTFDGKCLIMSDGSANLYFLEPESFTEVKRITVCDNKGRVERINEMEYIDGKIYANIWMTDDIIVINPENGKVTGVLNLKKISAENVREPGNDVANGIAYNAGTGNLYVTGKNWKRLYELKISD